MGESRTYFLARIWIGYAPRFDAARFDDVPDGEVPAALWEYAEEQLRRNPPAVDAGGSTDWAQIAEQLGWAHRAKIKDRMWLRPPSWQAFHVEPDSSISEDLTEALCERALGDHSFWEHTQLRLKTAAQDASRSSEWSNMERDIDCLQEGWQPDVKTDWGVVYPLNFLCNEAAELSWLLRSARGREDLSPRTGRAKATGSVAASGSDTPAKAGGEGNQGPELHLDLTDEAIIQFLRKHLDERFLTPQIAKALNRDPKVIGKNLAKLVRHRLLHNIRRKGYKIETQDQPLKR